MSDQGPVCHIPPPNQPANPQSRDIPGLGAPPGNDLNSIRKSIKDLQDVVRLLAGQIQKLDPTGSNGFKTKEDKKKDDGRWSEAARVVETVRVYNPNDREQYVDVEQINQLKMRDKVTGEQWTWDRNRK